MRYVEGSDLKKLLTDGALRPESAIGVAAQISGALDSAHIRGLVHRDVKPSNVLIAPGSGADGSDHVYLSDFGLTRRLADPAAAAAAEPLMATLEYVAPEQIRGGEVDGRADVYSFGCLLYECLAGVPPFRAASDAALLYAHLEEEPPRLSERGFPEAIDAVIGRALAKHPDARYQTARELVEEARAALGIARPATRPWWRTPAPLTLSGVALLAVAVAAFVLAREATGPALLPGADSLVRIDPVDNTLTNTMAVGRKASAVAVGAGSVWVANFADGTVWRIDPRSGRVLSEVSVQGTPSGLAVTGSSVLVANGPASPNNSTIVSLDAATGAFRFSTALPDRGFEAPLLAVGPEGAWFADDGAEFIARADPLLTQQAYVQVPIPAGTGNVLARYQYFSGLAVGEGSVWLLGDGFERVVWKVDPESGRVVERIRFPFVPRGIAAGEGAVWVTSVLDDTISRIDPATGRIIATVRVGQGADKVATGEGAVWVTNEIAETVTRIDPRTDRVVRTVAVGGRPRAIAVGAGSVWVTVGRQ